MSKKTKEINIDIKAIWEHSKTFVFAALAAILIRAFFFEPFHIPSGSMEPSLLVGDYLFVSKYSYGYSGYSLPFSPNITEDRIFDTPPKRGDVVVFRLPSDDKIDYIKRVIGLPGDRIQVKRGLLYINDKPVERRIISGGSYSIYLETFPGDTTSHTIMEFTDKGPVDNTPIFVVPEGHFFAMGDNRDNSLDSRAESGYVGFVPFKNLIGRAEIIFFSANNGIAWWNPIEIFYGIRGSRILKVIN